MRSEEAGIDRFHVTTDGIWRIASDDGHIFKGSWMILDGAKKED